MRRTATAMLLLMAAVFAATGPWIGVGGNGGIVLGFAHAFAEAALVGGLADWFAVTALFRHPLGLPIPHTAIIPVNKDRIADTMAQFLRENFLVPTVVARRLKAMHPAQNIGAFLTEPRSESGRTLAGGAGALIAEILESLDPARLGMQVRAGLSSQLARIEIAPLAGRMIAGMIADGRHKPLIDSAIRWLGDTLEDHEEMAREMIKARAHAVLRFTGLDARVANAVLDGAYRLLAEMLVDPDHPLRRSAEEGLQTLSHRLQHDPELRERVEEAKRELLENPVLAQWWMGVWERLRYSLIVKARTPGAMDGVLRGTLIELGVALQNDARLQWQIDRFARRTLVGVAHRYGGEIVRLVSETVKRWDAQTVTHRIEGAVGRDLQFIRINGTLVGGMVGLCLHAITQIL